ncbi:hypothetical protein BDR07DRAFT_1373405 [Suillus spraguei]|nr:hypothetical protein BDR07DRAFT_1373405 [Suillus spraguei]
MHSCCRIIPSLGDAYLKFHLLEVNTKIIAHPVLWRGKTLFYPIGNTPAVCLTQDLCPSEKADVLLLGCGDPRHILYTVYTNSTSGSQASRKLDFTCCDIESAVIARNVILFTLLADEGSVQKVPQIWNIFFHFFLDKASHDLLISQCRRLVELSGDLDSWNNGPYGHCLRMCTGDTLAELRRLWQLYIKTTTCSPSEAKAFASSYAADVKASKADFEFVFTASRAAGPLSMYAIQMAGDHYNNYWDTGVCSAVAKRPSEASHPNPTFAFSMVGDKFGVHWEQILSLAFIWRKHLHQLLEALANQTKWCTSVSKVLDSQGPSSLSPLIIRFCVGDALSLCQALDYSRTTKSTSTPFLIAPWKSACITFDPKPMELMHGPASGGSEVTLAEQLCGDIATIGLLLGLIPACFVLQFTTRLNMHESINFERLAWKLIGGAEKLLTDLDCPINITAEQLAGVFFNIYLDMFAHESVARVSAMVKQSTRSTMSGIIHYHRRSFVEILSVVKRRVITDWDSTMNMLHGKILNDRTLTLGMNFYQDLYCQLHLLGIFDVYWLSLQEVQEVHRVERPFIFRDWKMLPQTVCVVLVVPRDHLQPLLPALDGAGTPVLQCDLKCETAHNTFSSINTVFGTITTSGQGDSKTAVIQEDATGRHGTSPLVVWFWVPSILLAVTEHHLSVVLSAFYTPATRTLATKLRGLSIFRADLGDEKLVHILRQRPNAGPESPYEKNLRIASRPMKTSGGCTFVTLDEEYKSPLSFTTRMDIVEPEMRASLTSGATPTVNQVSMHSIAIVLGGKSLQSLSCFPSTPRKPSFALHESRYTSKYSCQTSMQVILPLKLVLGETDSDMFPVIPQGGDFATWNMHRVNLDQCIPFSIANKKDLGWVRLHVSHMMSERERRMLEGSTTESTLLDIKHTLLSIFEHASGSADGQPPLCYSLQKERNVFATLYITDLRLDLGSHAIVADAWVMPSSPSSEKFEAFSKVSKHSYMKTIEMGVEERKAWVHLLVAATERCRIWEHKTNCEYRIQGAIPLTLEPNESPICSCNAGVGTESAVISPLFALSYIEKVGDLEDIIDSITPQTPAPVTVPVQGRAVLLEGLSTRGLEKAQEELRSSVSFLTGSFIIT